ncbi:MAG TPA: ATP-dependent sacrificial sulfur transferase LarE [Syntrophorhabdaceae bacterium]|nr:ATP-dependent sacrificial sulfur transferase LarE [Syntrophorhabdaceae bacterium]
MDLQGKYNELKNRIENLKTVLVTYSGGLDSTLLLKACADALGKQNVVAFTGNAPVFPAEEIRDAESLASIIGVEFICRDTDVLTDPSFIQNERDRCYHCKKRLFAIAAHIAQGRKIACIVDGTNLDDIEDYRPGRKAAQEMNIFSPLLEAGLKKKDVRELTRMLDLPTRNKLPYACLATRIPYGTAIEEQLLRRLDASEKFIKGFGINQLRLRYHGEIARIETDEQDFDAILRNRAEIISGLRQFGFTFVTLDLQGYRTGSMNETTGRR